ncbi:MAG: glycosyltransferase [Bacteroides sp.]|nr:glycosyltransferase [Bacteroides sp.]MCM1447114.1 glycosyltransferase [Bacteroides sp.]MCM1515154.1 glycosyltransferase [Paraprevotella sp.]
MKYSLIIPVYNRPDEVDELLASLEVQTMKDFEVVIVEDGSTIPCQSIVNEHASRLALRYYRKDNSGPGQSRNYGAERSQGEYLIILDSDCVLPPGYLQAVDDELRGNPCDAFGGPDRAHDSFTTVQKAINYSMTSFFTTGGIRGGKKKLDKFYPRSFNMGIRADLYRRLGGFSDMRFGEDIDFSIRIFQSGASCRLFPEAWVWHKRRTDMKKFFKQVHNSGIARINLWKRHPGSLKPVHLLPAMFTIGLAFLAIAFLTGSIYTAIQLFNAIGTQSTQGNTQEAIRSGMTIIMSSLIPVLLFSVLIFTDSLMRNRSAKVARLSIQAAFIQLSGYGTGFLRAWWLRCVRSRNEELQAFKDNFYK